MNPPGPEQQYDADADEEKRPLLDELRDMLDDWMCYEAHEKALWLDLHAIEIRDALAALREYRAEHDADTADTMDGRCGCPICERVA